MKSVSQKILLSISSCCFVFVFVFAAGCGTVDVVLASEDTLPTEISEMAGCNCNDTGSLTEYVTSKPSTITKQHSRQDDAEGKIVSVFFVEPTLFTTLSQTETLDATAHTDPPSQLSLAWPIGLARAHL